MTLYVHLQGAFSEISVAKATYLKDFLANLILVDLVQFGGLTNLSQVCARARGICEGGNRLGDGGLWDGPPVLHHHV